MQVALLILTRTSRQMYVTLLLLSDSRSTVAQDVKSFPHAHTMLKLDDDSKNLFSYLQVNEYVESY